MSTLPSSRFTPIGWYGKKSITDPGTKRTVNIELHPSYPSDDTNYDAWLMVHNNPEHSGFTNDYITVGRTYNSLIRQLAPAVGGMIDPAAGGDLETIKKALVNAINNDPGAIVTASISHVFTVVDSATASGFTIDGVAYTGTGADGAAKVADLVTNLIAGGLNAAADGLKVYFSDAKDSVPSLPVIGTLSAATDHTIMLIAKSPNVKFNASYESEDFASISVADAGKYPVLDFERMMREWSVKEWKAGGYVKAPLDAAYVKYYLRIQLDNHPGLTGASSVEKRYREVEIFVLADLVDDLIWDANYMLEDDATGFAAAKTLEDMLADVFFGAPDTW